MRWLKQNVDSIFVLATVVSAVIWITMQMSGIKEDLSNVIIHKEQVLDKRMYSIERDVAIIKTILISKDILPSNLTIKEKEKPSF